MPKNERKPVPPFPKNMPVSGRWMIHYKGGVYRIEGVDLRVESTKEVWAVIYKSHLYPAHTFSRPIDANLWNKFTEIPRGARVWKSERWHYVNDYCTMDNTFEALVMNPHGELERTASLTPWEVNSALLVHEAVPEDWIDAQIQTVNPVRGSVSVREVSNLTHADLCSELLLIPNRQYRYKGDKVTLKKVINARVETLELRDLIPARHLEAI